MEYIGFKDSKNLKFALYDKDTEILYMYFNSHSLYKYMNFSIDNFKEFNDSDEKGKYFYDKIRNEFKYEAIY